jgi:hypothetical protein
MGKESGKNWEKTLFLEMKKKSILKMGVVALHL